MSTYSEVVKPKNKQGIFDRQNELCEFFITLNNNEDRLFNYRVTNDGIMICVMYDKHSQWNAVEGRKTLIKLVEKYKLDLIGYEKHKTSFTRSANFWTKHKLVVEYSIPLNLLKFDINVFLYSSDYLKYKKGEFYRFEKF